MNGVRERSTRGENLTKNLKDLKAHRVKITELHRFMLARNVKISYNTLKNAYYDYCPGERSLDKIEPLLKEFMENYSIPYNDWKININD